MNMNIGSTLERIERDLDSAENSVLKSRDLVEAHMKIVDARSRLRTLIEFTQDLRARAYELYGDI